MIITLNIKNLRFPEDKHPYLNNAFEPIPVVVLNV